VIVVDTSVWIDYFNGNATNETEVLDRLLGIESLIVGDLILVEVLQGFRSDRNFRQALGLLAALEFREMVGQRVALASARNYRMLRAQGVTVRKTVDVIIGTFCILNGHRLLHSDRDFDPMESHLGLEVVKAFTEDGGRSGGK
jgi:predicted nucleic acid-binding protein